MSNIVIDVSNLKNVSDLKVIFNLFEKAITVNVRQLFATENINDAITEEKKEGEGEKRNE